MCFEFYSCLRGDASVQLLLWTELRGEGVQASHRALKHKAGAGSEHKQQSPAVPERLQELLSDVPTRAGMPRRIPEPMERETCGTVPHCKANCTHLHRGWQRSEVAQAHATARKRSLARPACACSHRSFSRDLQLQRRLPGAQAGSAKEGF